MTTKSSSIPQRSAWIEIDVSRLKKNFDYILKDKPPSLNILSVIKDDAYGHGVKTISKIALEHGIREFGVTNLMEALEIREVSKSNKILMFGCVRDDEIEACLDLQISPTLHDIKHAETWNRYCKSRDVVSNVHIEIETGMGRYGVRYNEAAELISKVGEMSNLKLDGIYTHFAMSDELDKSFAHKQLNRFHSVIEDLKKRKIHLPELHTCNTGGFLDLPQAHFDKVRLGILPLGVFPSKVCRRIEGIEPVMTVKSKLAMIRELEEGDNAGYGLRFQAPHKMKTGVIPMGYGDGFPRVRNNGRVLIRGKSAQIIGGNAMDTILVNLENIPEAQTWDEVVIMGCSGDETISVHELAELKGSVSYDVLAGWRHRLPRIEVEINSPGL